MFQRARAFEWDKSRSLLRDRRLQRYRDQPIVALSLNQRAFALRECARWCGREPRGSGRLRIVAAAVFKVLWRDLRRIELINARSVFVLVSFSSCFRVKRRHIKRYSSLDEPVDSLPGSARDFRSTICDCESTRHSNNPLAVPGTR